MRRTGSRVDRRGFLKASGTLAAAVASGAMTVNVTGAPRAPATTRPSTSPAAPFALASAPVLLNPTTDGVTVVCLVNAPATGWVEYGPSEALGTHADGADAGLLPYAERMLSVRLTGLKPGQTYYYRLHAVAVDFRSAYDASRGAEIQSDVRSFRTLDPDAAAATFTVWNDTHQNKTTVAALIAALRQSPTDFLFWNGDITNQIDDEATILREFVNPTGTAYADAVPLFLGRGNHDVRGKYARHLSRYVAGPGGAYYYQFRHGPLAVLVMDTGEDKPDGNREYTGLVSFADYRTTQQKWLVTAIEDPQFKSAPFRVAFLHIPLFVSGFVPDTPTGYRGNVCEDGRAKWHDLLVRGKVDLVISGHTHRHGWFPATPDRPYGQLIGGGPKPAQATSITASADASKMEFVMKDLQGKVLAREAFSPRAATA
jgi:predicted phosphodiesterase